MKLAHVRVVGRFIMASRPEVATVTIDRDNGLFSVRPLHKRRVFTLPLATVSEIVVQRILKVEAVEKRRSKVKRP